MAHEVRWYLDRRVALVRIFGTISDMDEYRQINTAFFDLIAACEHPVHTIVDLTGVDHFPSDIREAQSVLRPAEGHEFGWILLVVHMNPLLRFVAGVVTQLTIRNVNMRMFTALEDALLFLQQHDETLPPLTNSDAEQAAD